VTRLTWAERSDAAERRAVEQGHYARVQPDGSVLVKSDTRPGKSYRVTFSAYGVDEPITFTCRPEGSGSYADDHRDLTGKPGACFCKHAALAARRLRREGLARRTGPLFGSLWVMTERAAALTEARLPPQPSDPFSGLPS
jgi:hypothetical protein